MVDVYSINFTLIDLIAEAWATFFEKTDKKFNDVIWRDKMRFGVAQHEIIVNKNDGV